MSYHYVFVSMLKTSSWYLSLGGRLSGFGGGFVGKCVVLKTGLVRELIVGEVPLLK
jgi:hypothetical protein